MLAGERRGKERGEPSAYLVQIKTKRFSG